MEVTEIEIQIKMPRLTKKSKWIAAVSVLLTLLGIFSDSLGIVDFFREDEPIVITETVYHTKTPIAITDTTTTTAMLTTTVIRTETTTQLIENETITPFKEK